MRNEVASMRSREYAKMTAASLHVLEDRVGGGGATLVDVVLRRSARLTRTCERKQARLSRTSRVDEASECQRNWRCRIRNRRNGIINSSSSPHPGWR